MVLVLRYLAEELKTAHMAECLSTSLDVGGVFRLDAKAVGSTAAIGGWRTGDSGRTKEAVCPAESLTRATAPPVREGAARAITGSEVCLPANPWLATPREKTHFGRSTAGAHIVCARGCKPAPCRRAHTQCPPRRPLVGEQPPSHTHARVGAARQHLGQTHPRAACCRVHRCECTRH